MNLNELKVLSDWVKRSADDIFEKIEEGKTVSITTNNGDTQMLVYKKDDTYKLMQAMPLEGRKTTVKLSSSDALVEYIYSQISLKNKPSIAYHEIDPETDLH